MEVGESACSTPQQYAKRLRIVDMRKNCPLLVGARRLGEPLGLTGHELLHEAIYPLLKPRSRRLNAAVEPVLRMTMRSIASVSGVLEGLRANAVRG
jgi:hypothetical protein